MKRKLAVFLVLAMCVVGFALPVSATTEFREVETIQPRYTYIDAVGAKISIDSKGKATCTGVGYAKDTYATVDLTIQLQRCTKGT